MSGVSVNLRIPVDDSWRAGDTLQVYTDFGTGTIDTDQPLLPRRIAAFTEKRAELGYGEFDIHAVPYGLERAPSQRSGGYGDQPYGDGVDGYGGGQPYVEVTVEVDETFGAWKFAAEVADAAGNVQADALTEITHLVSGEDPDPADSFAFNSYDSGNDQCVFDVSV